MLTALIALQVLAVLAVMVAPRRGARSTAGGGLTGVQGVSFHKVAGGFRLKIKADFRRDTIVCSFDARTAILPAGWREIIIDNVVEQANPMNPGRRTRLLNLDALPEGVRALMDNTIIYHAFFNVNLTLADLRSGHNAQLAPIAEFADAYERVAGARRAMAGPDPDPEALENAWAALGRMQSARVLDQNNGISSFGVVGMAGASRAQVAVAMVQRYREAVDIILEDDERRAGRGRA